MIVGHVPDPQNPADYLTKFVGKAKVELSNEYATRTAATRRRRSGRGSEETDGDRGHVHTGRCAHGRRAVGDPQYGPDRYLTGGHLPFYRVVHARELRV